MLFIRSGSFRTWLSMDSEAVQAGVFWMTPVRQDPDLNDLEGLVVLLLTDKNRNIDQMLADIDFCFCNGLEGFSTVYLNWENLQCVTILFIDVVPQQLSFFLVLIIKTLNKMFIRRYHGKIWLKSGFNSLVWVFLTKTVKLRGALVMFPVGERALGMCSRQKDVGRILRDSLITR